MFQWENQPFSENLNPDFWQGFLYIITRKGEVKTIEQS